jgi:hypothetical protein
LAQQVRVSHYQYFGTDYPYHYAVAQLQQESNCKNVVSLDGVGSEGPAQITYRVWKNALAKQGIGSVKTTANNLRAQAFINKCAYNEARYKKLWIAFQVYNGGGLVNKEIQRAGKVEWQAARDCCRRKVVHFKGGYTEDACDINYSYSKRIFRFADSYRTAADSKTFSYW